MTPSPDRLARLRGVDWWALACCAVAVGVYLAHGVEGRLSRDVGVYAYAGQQVADGVAPYVGILNRSGPLAHLIPGAGVAAGRLVGLDDVVGIRLLFLLIAAACVGLMYVVGRDMFRSRLAGLSSAAALLCFEGFIDLAAYGPREKTPMILFLLATLLATVHRRWATAGVCIALGALTWQPVFPVALVCATTAALVGLRSGRVRALLRIAVGGAVPAAVTLGAYAAIGEVRLLLDDFLLINLRYTQQEGFLTNPDEAWISLVNGYGASLAVFLVGLAALLGLTVAALVRRRDLSEPSTAALVGTGAAAGVAVLWTYRAYNSWPDVFFLLPLAAVGIGGLAGHLRHRLPLRAAVAVTVAWALAATAIALVHSVTDRDTRIRRQRASVAAVMSVVPDARIASVGAPEAMVLARQRNPAPIQLLGLGLSDYVDDTWPGGLDGYARWITEDRRPLLMALGNHSTIRLLGPRFRDHYQRVGRAPTWIWFVRRDAPESVRDTLRSTLRRPDRPVQG
jgi:hypothetical protein